MASIIRSSSGQLENLRDSCEQIPQHSPEAGLEPRIASAHGSNNQVHGIIKVLHLDRAAREKTFTGCASYNAYYSSVFGVRSLRLI